MTAQELIKAAREFTDAYNAGDWERFRNSMAPNVVYDEVASQRRFTGPEEVLRAAKAWKQAGPDCTGKISLAEAAGNRVFIEVLWTATHSGPLEMPLGTIPPSGKTWNVPAAQVITIENNKITSMRHYFDMVTLLQQIGALKGGEAKAGGTGR